MDGARLRLRSTSLITSDVSLRWHYGRQPFCGSYVALRVEEAGRWCKGSDGQEQIGCTKTKDDNEIQSRAFAASHALLFQIFLSRSSQNFSQLLPALRTAARRKAWRIVSRVQRQKKKDYDLSVVLCYDGHVEVFLHKLVYMLLEVRMLERFLRRQSLLRIVDEEFLHEVHRVIVSPGKDSSEIDLPSCVSTKTKRTARQGSAYPLLPVQGAILERVFDAMKLFLRFDVTEAVRLLLNEVLRPRLPYAQPVEHLYKP
eukprot:754313-Hanusia_phi.AAC.3